MGKRFITGAAEKLYQWLREKRLLREAPVQKDLIQLYGGNRLGTEYLLQKYYTELIQKTMLAALLIGILIIAIAVESALRQTDEIRLERTSYGEEATEYSLQVSDGQAPGLEIQIEVPAVEYTEPELKEQFQNGFQYLEAQMLGDNITPDMVKQNLNLEKTIPESGIRVQWSSDDYELLEDNGTVHNQTLKEPAEVCLRLELSYADEVQQREYRLVIYPGELTDQELMKQKVSEAVTKAAEEQRYEREVILPGEIAGYRLQMPSDTGRIIAVILIGGIVIMLMLWMRKRENLHREVKKHKQQLLLSYPGFVNQLQLYLGAGATVQGALERVMQLYETRHQTTQVLYRELEIMRNEIGAGITQEEAYIRLGRRTGLAPYMRLMSLLGRQIRTGGHEIRIQLEEEAQSAFTYRKEQAKKAGEEAGTKLLLPMILLMVISMAVILIPAWKDFSL